MIGCKRSWVIVLLNGSVTENKGYIIEGKEVPWYPATTIQLIRNIKVYGNFHSW